jgi:hypothetical protein
MLYCDLNDAFNNKNYKIRDTFSNNDGDEFNISRLDLSQFNSSNNQIMYESNKKGQESDWATVDSETELLPKKKSKQSWDNDTIDTDKRKISKNNISKSDDLNSNDIGGTTLTKLIKNKKPTHRECLKLYYNPTSKSIFSFDIALKHISKCELCKKEISKKKSVKFEDSQDKVSCSSSLNSFINNIRQNNNNKDKLRLDNETIGEIIKSSKKTKLLEKPVEKPKNDENESIRMSEMQSQMESQSPPVKQVIQTQEENHKIQNLMIQNTIQKYFEEMEEKKGLNDKLNKIYEILNLEMKKNEIIEKERSLTQMKNNNNEPNFIYILIGISIVIILLIIDIVIRIKF